ncbi:acyltransferase family protein [Bradyrhizobium sp. USDA 3315]
MESHRIGQGSPRHHPQPELRALTGLRGVAATAVALAHFQQLYPNYSNVPFMWHNAVDLFFCLSGFTICYVYRRETFQFSSYLAARVARIYPLYLLTLVVAGVSIVWPLQINPTTYPVKNALSDLLLQGFMLNSWPLIGSGVHWMPPAWSISVEWFCYVLLFPLLLFQKAPRSTPMRLLCIVLLSATSYSVFVRFFDGNLATPEIYEPRSQWSYWVGLLRGVFSFTAGWIVFWCFEKRDGLYTFCINFPTLIWLAVVLIVLLGYCGGINPQALVFLFPFVLLAATSPTSVTSRILGSKVLHFIGVISYSIYMMHFVLLIGFLAAFGSPDTWSISVYALSAAISLVVFTGTYFAIEMPARNAIRDLRRMRLVRRSA